MTLFSCLADKPCFHTHPSNDLKQRFYSSLPPGVSQFIIKLFDLQFFSCRFCRSRKRYAFFVNFPSNLHPLSSLLTTGLTICQEFKKRDYICGYIISFPCLVYIYSISIHIHIYIYHPSPTRIHKSSLLLSLFDLLILLVDALTSLQENK